MVTRTISNVNDPIVNGLGVPQANIKISFTLVNVQGAPMDVWDAFTGEQIAPGPVEVSTDNNGIFSVSLWPTSRGDRVAFWQCSVSLPYFSTFKSALLDGTGVVSWFDFRFGIDSGAAWQGDIGPSIGQAIAGAAVAFIPRVSAVEIGQSAAVIGYETQAALYADLAHADKSVAYVTNDTTASKNGTYRKSGASGSGSWAQSSYDRVALVENRAAALEGVTATLVPGKNLFNTHTALANYYVASGGAVSPSTGFYASDFIPVAQSTKYSITRLCFLAEYDASKVFISGTYVNTGGTGANTAVTTNASTHFIRVSFYIAYMGVAQVELGLLFTAYEVFCLIDGNYKSKIRELETAKLTLNATKNLFDPTTVADNYSVETDGSLTASADFHASDFIPVAPSTQYSATKLCFLAQYDSNRAFIGGTYVTTGTTGTNTTVTTASNAAYIRVTFYTTFLSIAQVEAGSACTSYECHWIATAPNGSRLAPDTTTPGSLLIPSSMFLIQGRPLQVSSMGLTEGRDNRYDIGFVGYNAAGERITIEFANPVANLDGNLYDGAGAMWAREKYNSDTVFTKPVGFYSSPGTKTGSPKILCIGDSLTYQGSVSALHTKLVAAGVTPVFMGTKKEVGGLWADGRSSYHATNYTFEENFVNLDEVQAVYPVTPGTEAAYLASETAPTDFGGTWSGNPFIRTTTGGDNPDFVFDGYIFDMRFYLNRFSMADPDVVMIELGVNDFTNNDQATALAKVMRSVNIIYTQTRAALPNAKIAILLAGFPSFGLWTKIMPYFKAVLETYSGRETDKVFVLPIYTVMDLMFSYGITVASTDPQTGVETGVSGNFVHPNAQGRSQWAEMTFGFVMNMI